MVSELKQICLSVKVQVGDKRVRKKLTAKNVGNIGFQLSELKDLLNICQKYVNREQLLEALLDKNKEVDNLNREVLKCTLAYKESIIYFEAMEKSIKALITKKESLPVLLSRIKFKGKGSNYKTLSERVALYT